MGKEPFSAVINALRKWHQSSCAGSIEVGKRTHAAVRQRLRGVTDPGTRRRLRAETVDDIKAAAIAAGLKAQSNELNRLVGLFHVSELYGVAESKTLSGRTLAAFCATVQRVAKNETWKFKPKIENLARHVFDRAISGELSSDQVKLKVDDLLGRKPRTPQAKPSPARRVLTALARLSKEQQIEVYRALEQKFDKPLPAGNVSIPIASPPGSISPL